MQIFNQSLSGMEIIMRDINNEIVSAISADFKYGLLERIPAIIELANKKKNIIMKKVLLIKRIFPFGILIK